MDNLLKSTFAELTDIQQRAVDWEDGSVLVLAVPGSGKTRVLTCRIARLLDSSRDKRFRILALTFTNKAANEMAERVAALIPGLEGRANVGTFHSFCAQVLRQHGVHLGIKPDFAIYSQTEDRQALLEDALRRATGPEVSSEDVRFLPLIDRLKARLIGPEQAEDRLSSSHTTSVANRAACVYRLYEEELRRASALDFNSLIFETHRLFTTFPIIAREYQRSHPYWLIDEFQDTNGAQYALIRSMATGDFGEVFAVADDDQTIFEWNDANVRRIGDFVRDFSSAVVQLPTNFRCPPMIVETANRLVVYNSRRVTSKQSAAAVKKEAVPPRDQQIQLRTFDTDHEEVDGIADEVRGLDTDARSETAILARNRSLLKHMRESLARLSIPVLIVQRRGDFLSPQMRWLVACLKQISRPLDRRNMGVLVDSFDRFAGWRMEWDSLVSRSEVDRTTCLSVWTEAVSISEIRPIYAEMVNRIAEMAAGDNKREATIDWMLEQFQQADATDDLEEDLNAWRHIARDIAKNAQGYLSLDQFLQELDLRSKEPVPHPGTVSLMTIHSAKGREFDTVYLMGLAEDIMPSFHSIKRGNSSPEIEEERRNCFVAITRAKKRLILSWARQYKGWQKAPSRFLQEMGVLSDPAGNSLQHEERK